MKTKRRRAVAKVIVHPLNAKPAWARSPRSMLVATASNVTTRAESTKKPSTRLKPPKNSRDLTSQAKMFGIVGNPFPKLQDR